MPILHIQASARAQRPDGSIVDVPPQAALTAQGPCLQVNINIAQAFAAQLLQQGVQLPSPRAGIALIDTGASVTCIDSTVAEEMRLPVVNVVNMTSASHKSTQQNVYPVQIEVTGLPITFDTPQALGANLSAQGYIALIGRDVLEHCTLFYNGLSGEVTLSI